MNGAEWLALFQKRRGGESVVQRVSTTHNVTYAYVVAGNQQWNNLSIVSQPTANGTSLRRKGVKSTPRWRCVITRRGWRISNIFITTQACRKLMVTQRIHHLPDNERISFRYGRTHKYDAQSAGSGAKFGRIDSDITISGNTLTLTNGLIDTGFRGSLPMGNG